ncbi:MAG: NAD(P)/FAD-dependent oxidoreductase [Myxococcales bacterium]|nr:NAD(P)/FAD-dependent oxidoreductase [Myxococcales bacterium]
MSATTTASPSIVIIGAGFAGICMAIQLRKAGIHDFVILEAAARVGGTWRDNTYPGCACDIPSHLYSYSFEPRTSWSRKYSPQPEILDYIEHCVDKYELDPHLHLGVTVTRAVFDEVSARWELEAADGRRWSARAVVAGLGALRVPAIPELPGIERFQGAAFHSARWDHSVDLRGKRVAVVGTGASAIQFVPAIAPEVAQLTLFQRTPPWILPKADRAFREGEKAFFGRFPGLERVYRKALYWKHEATAFGFVRHPRFLKVAERMARQHIKASIADPALRAKVTPSFSIGCKRILISNDYYPALNRPNVEVRTDGIAEVRERSVVTGEGREIEVDAILYGTGFAVADFLAPMEVRGIGGRELSEAWRDGAQAYLGTAVAGFPNFFMIIGPNTGLGHNSMVFMIEAHVHYILQCVQSIVGGVRTLEVREDAQERFNRSLQAQMRGTVWQTGCQSWYLDDHGRNFTLWPSYTWAFWLRTRRVRREDYVAA